MASVQGYGLSKEELAKLQNGLTTFASGRIAAHMQEAANTALSRMKDRSVYRGCMAAPYFSTLVVIRRRQLHSSCADAAAKILRWPRGN